MEESDVRAWLLDREIVTNEVGLGLVNDARVPRAARHGNARPVT
jgi:hypothetical protein